MAGHPVPIELFYSRMFHTVPRHESTLAICICITPRLCVCVCVRERETEIMKENFQAYIVVKE